jgi:hypothetical protein
MVVLIFYYIVSRGSGTKMVENAESVVIHGMVYAKMRLADAMQQEQ